MISERISYFDLRRICDSGQIFRMYEREDGVFDVYSGDRFLRLIQRPKKDNNGGEPAGNGKGMCSEDENAPSVDLFCSQEEFDGYWKRFFDLERDYGSIVKKAMQDRIYCTSSGVSPTDEDGSFLADACLFGSGIRILKQDIWEMMISFIVSQQKQIPSIRKCIEALCERYGEKKTVLQPEKHTWYTFPTARKIAAGGPDGLKGLSLGYRERYIYETAVKYLSDGLPDEKVETMGLEAAREYFKSFCGIGEKVANCICLFGAGYVDAFPIDTHIKDILFREFYLRYECPESVSGNAETGRDRLSMKDYENLTERYFGQFKGYRGIVQQWIFAYELDHSKNNK